MFNARNIVDAVARAVRSAIVVVRDGSVLPALPLLPLLPYYGSGSGRVRPDRLEMRAV